MSTRTHAARADGRACPEMLSGLENAFASVLSLPIFDNGHLVNGGADALVRARPPGRALALIVNCYARQETRVVPAFHVASRVDRDRSRQSSAKVTPLPVARSPSSIAYRGAG